MHGEITLALEAWNRGEQNALSQLAPLVYVKLQNIAISRLRHERPNHTLQPADIVNEVFLRFSSQRHHDWRDRMHFYAVAAGVMRRVLTDYVRKRRAGKRGGDLLVRVDLSEAEEVPVGPHDLDLVALDLALDRLGQLDPRLLRIVEMRVFGGLSVEETAEALELSSASVKREWKLAKAWLLRELRGG